MSNLISDKLESAYEELLPESILTIVLGEGRNDIELLLNGAGKLRNLMSFSGVLEVAERVLTLDPKNIKALEL